MDRNRNATRSYPSDFRERAGRVVADRRDTFWSVTAALGNIEQKFGCSGDSLSEWDRPTQHEAEMEARPISTKVHFRDLERENGERRQCRENEETARRTVFPVKRDYIQMTPLPDAKTARGLIGGRIEDEYDINAHSGLKMRGLRAFKAVQTAAAGLSGETGARPLDLSRYCVPRIEVEQDGR